MHKKRIRPQPRASRYQVLIEARKRHDMDILEEQLRKGKQELELQCLMWGHEYRVDIFEMGDCVCIRCGKDKV